MSLLGPESQQVAALLLAVVVVSLDEHGMAMEMEMELTTFTSLRIPYRAAEKKERSERGPTKTSVNRTASPLPLSLPLAICSDPL